MRLAARNGANNCKNSFAFPSFFQLTFQIFVSHLLSMHEFELVCLILAICYKARLVNRFLLFFSSHYQMSTVCAGVGADSSPRIPSV